MTDSPARARRIRSSGGFRFATALVWLYAAVLLIPLFFLFISSFKTNDEMFTAPFAPTFSQGLDNVFEVIRVLDVGRALWNSVYVTAGCIVLTLVLAVPAAYGIAQARGRVGALVERVFAAGFLIPGLAALLPSVLLAAAIGLFQTREFLILSFPAGALPLAVILLVQFMRTVPPELQESARIDGAGPARIFLSVYMPLVAPGIATVAILNFINFWNEYLFSLVLAGPSPEQRTIQVALSTLVSGLGITDYALLAAGSLISVIPVFVVYAILNRRMEDALVSGAVKG